MTSDPLTTDDVGIVAVPLVGVRATGLGGGITTLGGRPGTVLPTVLERGQARR